MRLPRAALPVVTVIAALSVPDWALRQTSRLAVIVWLAVASAESVYVTRSEPHRTPPLAATLNAASTSGSGSGSFVDGVGATMVGPVGSLATGTGDLVARGVGGAEEAEGATGGVGGPGAADGTGDADPLASSGGGTGSPGRVSTTTTSTATTAAAPAAAHVLGRRDDGNPSRPSLTSGGPAGRQEAAGRTVNGTATYPVSSAAGLSSVPRLARQRAHPSTCRPSRLRSSGVSRPSQPGCSSRSAGQAAARATSSTPSARSSWDLARESRACAWLAETPSTAPTSTADSPCRSASSITSRSPSPSPAAAACTSSRTSAARTPAPRSAVSALASSSSAGASRRRSRIWRRHSWRAIA
ncbi:hypothetical protein GCM10022251_63590 [Phytohabitans flavus]|uniref:Uncharacterized protein n=1 Tax=Phytohabitans flavus TaxID=1076124 RepID=A0A6F8XUV6_9ACTN|nr:hypothetical protein Pflav_040520 [Phytohabitans flavus]